jgi:TonB-linked SusC/RagA family outer membrane protein
MPIGKNLLPIPGLKRHLLYLFLLLQFAAAAQQTTTITGTVKDSSGKSLQGVSVVELKNSRKGVSTDQDGKFTIQVKPDGILEFSSVGFAAQRVPVSGNSAISIILSSASSDLGDVIVVGYGTQKKRDLTGAVASIKGAEIKNVSAGDASALLQGRIAGVVVQNGGGAPGATPTVIIRGTGTFGNDQPLYVIDGMITTSMAFVNPNDIESIEVLKDASAAAIYGSRASNGVVLITTKQGSNGEVKINLNVKAGTQSPTNTLDFLNARQYADWNNQAHDNDGQPRAAGNDAQFNPAINTDWQDLYLGSAPLTDYNLSFSGGGQNAKYFISGQYYDQKGIVVDTRFKRYNVRANSSFTKGRFKLTEALSVSRSVNNPNVYFGNETSEIPTMPVYDNTKLGGFGGLEPSFAGVARTINYYGLSLLNQNKYTTDQLLGNVGMEYEFFKGLKYKLNLGLDYAVYHNYNFTPAFFMSSSQGAFNDQADLNESISRNLNTLIEHTLSYDKSLGNHRFELLAGYTAQKGSGRSLGVQATNFPSNDLSVVNAALNRTVNSSGDLQEFVLHSILGRLNYNFKSKYLFSATIRRDGSSRFLYDKNTYGYFPSFSAGWRVSEEEFFPKNGWVSDLKLRGSYGVLGSQNIANYITSSSLNVNTDYYFAGGVQPGVALVNFSNPDIIWESTKTTDFGVDLSLFNNRLSINADYFNKRSYDIHADIPIPIYGGVGSSLLKNAATIDNKGFEMAVTYKSAPVSKDGFKYSVTGIFSKIKNEVMSLGDGVSPITSGGFTNQSIRATRTDEGQPVGSFWGYQVLGIYQSQDEIAKDGRTDARPGDFRFSKEPGWLGNPFPKFEYGFTFNGSYKNFDLNIFFQGVSGNKLWNAKRGLQHTLDYASNKVTDVLRAWTPQNTNTDIPRATQLDPASNKRASSYYIEDGSYLRLKNLSIGYNLPASMIAKLKITNARVYLSGQNILTFTKYKGYDPEVGRNSSTQYISGLFSAGVDIQAYPQAKIFSAGIDLSF